MKKILTIIAFTSMLFAPGAIAEDKSYLDEWKKTKENASPGLLKIISKESIYLDEFKPWFLMKEFVKVCHEARDGMATVYYTPAEYSEAMQSYNRQLDKFTSTEYKRGEVGKMEESILNSEEYTVYKRIILSSSFSSGYEECNQFRVALLMAEYGM